ncbi:transglutaminase domain-containing protein [Actinobacillus equuli]|nr:transglutaminase domain-containing protein [Actinobacillus equuli]
MFILRISHEKLLLATLLASSVAFANQVPSYNTTTHTYEFNQSYDLVVPQGSKGETNLWVPLPFSNDYQDVKSIEFEGNYNKAYITEITNTVQKRYSLIGMKKRKNVC